MEHLESPIFIHSLFRAGSTYLFNVFRRSESGYWCYQEPLNERLLNKAANPDDLLVAVDGVNEMLRHPHMDKPHNYEFHVVAKELLEYFHSSFSYDDFFVVEENKIKPLITYFTALKNGAKGRVVFQCCRTTGRVSGLKKAFSGIDIFLWRNPWDQWWSYKHDQYFDSRNLFIACAQELPGFLQLVKNQLGIPGFDSRNNASKQAYCTNRILDSEGSYALFYALWCHAMLYAKPLCDISISIDELSESEVYRKEVTERMLTLGVDGIDFNDCNVPKALYGNKDSKFFLSVETKVHNYLLSNGYDEKQVEVLKELSQKRKGSLIDTSLPENAAVRDAMQAREYFHKSQFKLSQTQSQLFSSRARVQQAEQRLQQAGINV